VILYLDSSALVKRYVSEPGSQETKAAIEAASVVGTAVVSRAEVAAALAKAVRMDALTQSEAWASLQVFRAEWNNFVQVQVNQMVVARADTLAWEQGLRGYNAVHLASALIWQESMHQAVTCFTFDLRLWNTARSVGLTPGPPNLPDLLDSWRASQP